MADNEVPATADAAIRGFLVGVLGFASGFESIVLLLEAKFLLAVGALGMGVALTAAGFYWPQLKPMLGPKFARTLGAIATDARWWIGVAGIVILGIAYSPLLERTKSAPPLQQS